MTQEELNTAISEMIVNTDKPKYKTNSYFRKYHEKKIIKKHINYILHESKIEIHNFYDIYADYDKKYRHFRGVGIAYNYKRGRFKKLSYTYSGKDKRLKKFNQTMFRKAVRRYKGKISDGSMYKIIRAKKYYSDVFDIMEWL